MRPRQEGKEMVVYLPQFFHYTVKKKRTIHTMFKFNRDFFIFQFVFVSWRKESYQLSIYFYFLNWGFGIKSHWRNWFWRYCQ